MKLSRIQVMTLLITIFLSVQFLGLTTGYQYLQMVSIGEIEPVMQETGNPLNSLWLFAYILAMTGVILLIVKYKKKLLTVIEGLAIFFTSDIVFELLIPVNITIPGTVSFPIGPILALILTAVHLKRPTYLTQNVALIFAVSGAGAVLGSSLGVLPVLVFILLLGIYDFISVFYTKHMLYMAKAITERPRAFTAALPSRVKGYSPLKKHVTSEEEEEGHTFQLGGGDLAIPLMFTVSLLQVSLVSALAASLGSLIALIMLFSYMLKKPGLALPALPPITSGAIIGFLLSLLII